MKRQFLLFSFALLLVAVVAGCNSSSDNQPAAESGEVKQVKVATVERLAASSQRELVGTVVARNTANIETKIQARVEQIPVKIGVEVRKGEVLATLDTRELRAQVQQAQALQEQTSVDLNRYEELLKKDATTQQQLDAARAQAAVAEANLNQAEALLSYARILAPFSGVVTQRMIDVGDLAVPGRPLFVIEEKAAPQFVVTVPESYLNAVKIGQSVRVAIPSMDTIFTGSIEELSPSADPVSRSFTAKVYLPAGVNIRPGQFGRLLLPTGDDDGLFVPSEAVVRRGQLELVYVVTPEKKAALRLVRTGRQSSDKTEILSGLSDDERVAVTGAHTLTEGDTIEELL